VETSTEKAKALPAYEPLDGGGLQGGREGAAGTEGSRGERKRKRKKRFASSR